MNMQMSAKRRVALLLIAALSILMVFYLLRSGTFSPVSSSDASASSRPEETPKSAASGKTFANKVVRQFPAAKLRFKNFVLSAPRKDKQIKRACERWAVVTTIFDPSEAIERQSKLVGWCMVIVGDKKSPGDYDTGWTHGEGNEDVVYLDPKAQEALKIPFVDALPWNHFSRKNVGYLYAITHGAKVIWDFDDDNLFKFWVPGAAPANSPSIDAILASMGGTSVPTLHPEYHAFPTYNPYPALGAPAMPSWPRGLPLNHVKSPESYNSTLVPRTTDSRAIAVLQSLADVQPDVDAIYRLTMPIPFNFKRSKETKPLIVPTGVLTPYNAQATLHFEPGFWALLLPITVHGRVSDIWRSYFAQRLFWDVGLRLGFAPRPLVVQDRNAHNILGDLNAEEDLYQKSEFLVKFLGTWKSSALTLVERTEQLWVALYERQYIELRDVEIVQLWLQSLVAAGYAFPPLVPIQYNPAKPQEEGKRSSAAVKQGPCTVSKSLTFWTSDLNDGARMDLTSVLSSMDQKVVVASSREASGAPYPKVFELPGVSVSRQLSDPLLRLVAPATKLTESLVESNFKFYQTSAEVASTSAFVCSYPASLCELWMPFNKSIVFLPSHRYNLGRCTRDEWERLNEHVRLLASGSDPKHTIAAQSKYDLEYLKHYTGISPLPLFTYGGLYTQAASYLYSPNSKEVFVFNFWQDSLARVTTRFVLKAAARADSKQVLDDPAKHPAVVFFPNSVSSYLFVELYSLAIPIFVPSMKMLLAQRQPGGIDRTLAGDSYCKNADLDKVVTAHPASNHPYSPSAEGAADPEAEAYWLQFSNFFQLPHVVYFEDYDDLGRRLEQADLGRIHGLMVKENARRKAELLQNWCRVAETVDSNRRIPKDFGGALKALYGVTRLQVD